MWKYLHTGHGIPNRYDIVYWAHPRSDMLFHGTVVGTASKQEALGALRATGFPELYRDNDTYYWVVVEGSYEWERTNTITAVIPSRYIYRMDRHRPN